MKTTFYLIRHGEAEINTNPLQKTETDTLTESGLEQALSLARRFQNTSIQNIYTSKISRARLTAQEIGAVTHLTPIIIESLKERKVTYTDHHSYSYDETFTDFKARLSEVQRFLENIAEESIIVVSHALCIRGIIAYITFGDLLTEELLHKLNDMLIIDTGSVTKLIHNIEKNTWKIGYLNVRSHLK